MGGNMNKPICYKAPCQWSADSCCKCQYDMECYKKFLEFMMKNKGDKK